MAATNSWHSDIKTWTQRNKFLFKNKTMSDCSFVVIEGTNKTIIPAHKYVLGGNSSEFYNLFYLMQANDEIPIEDTSADVLTKFLEFLYTENTTLTMENIGDLLKLSKRFSVTHFDDFCAEFLYENVNEVNALSIMDKCADHKMPNLFSKCIKIIRCDKMIFESPSFLKISIQTLTELLKSNELRGFKEITVFKGVNKWSENYCQKQNMIINSENKRLAVKPALKFIRFASMPFKEFTLCTLNNPILTSAEIIEIYQFIGTDNSPGCKFLNEKRLRLIESCEIEMIDETIIHDQCSFNAHNHYNAVNMSLQFSVSEKIIFHGIGILGRTKKSIYHQNPECLLIVLQDSKRNEIIRNEVSIHYDGTEKTYDLVFDKAILMKPNEVYLVYVHRKISGSFYNHCFANKEVLFDSNPKEKGEEKGLAFKFSNSNKLFKTIIFSEPGRE